MNYFTECKTLDDAKNLFRRLCFSLHPDYNNGSDSEFIKMHAEFKTVSNKLKFSTGYDADKDFNADKFYNIVKSFEHLNDISISFVGSFVWLEDIVTGATYEQKNDIKKICIDGYNNARFARKKIKWYFSPSDYKQKFSSGKTLEQIKSTYGCNSFATKGTKQVN